MRDAATRLRSTTWQEPRDFVLAAWRTVERGDPLTIEQTIQLLHIIGEQRAIIALQDDRVAELTPSPRYHDYLQSPEWDRMRNEALAYHGHRCQICGNASNLQAHHRTYDRLGNEDMDDLVVLCDRCHKRHHRFIQ